MKKIVLIFTVTLLFFKSEAQNLKDIYYTPLNNFTTDFGQTSGHTNNTRSYNGEYQIIICGNRHSHTWEHFINTNALSYKVEAVSFPFIPDAITATNTTRPMVIPASAIYS
jgi:hypothetical protein